MTQVVTPEFRTTIADRLEVSNEHLALKWLEKLKAVVPVADAEVFPGDPPLGEAPAMIRELAGFLRAPAAEAIAANSVVAAATTGLGHLRHAQHASVHQVMREYRALRTVVGEFIKEETRRLELKPTTDEAIELMDLVESAVGVLLQITVDAFVAEYTDTIGRHTTRLEGFNRMVSHELRQPLGILQFAVKLLATDESWRDRAKRDQILATARRTVTRMNETLGKLVALSRSGEGSENVLVQRVELTAMAEDVIGQMREMADTRGVEVRIAGALPQVTIDAARLELVLVNLISNAIKYSDPNKPVRFVEIAAMPDPDPDTRMLSIRDNGIGIAESDLRSIFARFYRGRPERDRELGTSGLGLGLSIVADCIDAVKGDIRVESTLGDGTTFFLELPYTPQA